MGKKGILQSCSLDADGKHIFELSGQFQIPTGGRGKKPEVNLILEWKNLVFPAEGMYQFVLLVIKTTKAN